VARVYGSIFLIWLIFLAISLLFKKPKHLAISIALLTFVGLANVEKFIAQNNPPTVNNRIDYVYLSSMSTDGYEGWKMALDHAKKILDRDWKVLKPIDSDTRQEVAYTYFILIRLNGEYHKLVSYYGDDVELNYYRNRLKDKNDGSEAIPVFSFFTNPFYNKGTFYIKFVNKVELTRLDKIFNYNYSQKQAFDNWQKDFGGPDVLFFLQDKYYQAKEVIISQGKVDFDFDISRGLFD
jgi:hypothetical protein